jgi:hypothetical protein
VVAEVRFTAHAFDRYREHVRPDCEREQAERELAALAVSATVKPEAPEWVTRRELTADAWLWLTDDLACPLKRQRQGAVLLAVSVMARGAVSEEERQWRNERKAGERQRRQEARHRSRRTIKRLRRDTS